MKKNLVLGSALVLATVFLSGCGSAPAPTDTAKNDKGTATTNESKTDSIVGSLKDAIGLGKKMQCTSKDASGDSVFYIDGKKYKGVTTTKEGNQISIFTGEDFFSWNEKTKEGLKMTKACTDELTKDLPKTEGTVNDQSSFETTDKLIEQEDVNNNCKETTVAVDFSIPSDVKFVDQCELMKNITKNMPANLKDLKIPGQ